MLDFDSGIVHLSFLPLNHIFERIIQHILIISGGSCGFYHGDPTKVIDDIQLLRPTIFAGVPKIFDYVYETVMRKVEAKSKILKGLFNWTLKNRLAKFKRGIIKKNLFERLVFKAVTDALGSQGQRALSLELLQ